MIRAAAIAAPLLVPIIGMLALMDAPGADAQSFRGDAAYATFSMACSPPGSRQPGNVIIYATGSQVVPAGTAVTVTYMEAVSTRTWFGTYLNFVERTTVYRTKHTMVSYDPEVVGVYGYCLSATYTSGKAVVGW
jgi:hypothetical protein